MTTFSQNLNLTLPDAGEFPGTWAPPLNTNLVVLDALFGASGHTHSGVSGDGGRINHSALLGIGANSHVQIDGHIANTALHQDTRIALVETFDSSSVATDVSTMQFANSLVEEISPGVVRITPAPQNNTDFAKSAPVTVYESFGGNPGTDLTELGWAALKGDEGDPDYLIGSGASSPAAGVTLTVPPGLAKTTHYTAVQDNFFPHSRVQRVGVKVRSYGPATPQTAGSYGLWLHLLGSKREVVGNSPTAPIEQGLSLVLRTSVVAGEMVLSPDWVVRRSNGQQVTYSTDFRNPTNFTHPNSELVYERLPVNFFLGSHEISFAVDSTLNPTEFTLRYYYNGGLIFQRVFKSSDTQVTAFYQGVMALLDDLKQVSSPSTPDYGQWGFSTTYTTVADVEYKFNIQAFFASSIEELTLPRFVSYPAGSDVVVDDPVCPGNGYWTGTNVGDFIDMDGSSGNGPLWEIIGTFPADGLLSSGFNLRSEAGATTSIYCDPPIVSGEEVEGELPPLTQAAVMVEGQNLSAPEGTLYRFFAASDNIPTVWASGNLDNSYLAIGDELPADFARINNTVRTTTSTNQFEWTATGGIRTPWGALVDVKATPAYQSDPAFVQDFPKAFKIVAAPPSDVAVNIFKFNQGSWELIGPEGPFTECDTLFISVSGKNLPLGINFWGDQLNPSTLGVNYGFQRTVGTAGTGSAIRPFNTEGLAFDLIWNRIYRGKLDVGAGITGTPPLELGVTIPTDQDPGVGFAVAGSVSHEHQVILTRLGVRAFNSGSSGEYQLRFRDTENGVNFAPALLIENGAVLPKPPVIDPGGTSIGTFDPATPTTVTVEVEFPDADMEVEFDTPFGGTAGPYNRNSDQVLVTGDAFREVWSIQALEFTGSAGTPLNVTVTNVAAETQHTGLGTDSISLGVIGGSAGQTPVATYVSGDLVEDEESTIVFSVDTTTLEDNTTYSLQDPSGALVITPGPVTLGPIGGGGLQQQDRSYFATLADGETVVPATVQMVITNYPSGLSLTIPNIPVVASSPNAPVIDQIHLGTPTSGVTDFDITQGSGNGRTLFIRVLNVTPAEFQGFSIVNPSAGVVMTPGNINERFDIDPAGSGLQTWYSFEVTRVTGAPGGTFGIRVNKLGGLSDTVDPAITLTAGINFWDLTGSLTTAQEGHFAEFSILGNFYVTGSNLEVDLLDGPAGSGVTLIDPTDSGQTLADLSVMSPGLIKGSARLKPNTLDDLVYYKFTYTDSGVTRTEYSTSRVGDRPNPIVDSFTISPNTANSVGAVVTVTGSFLAPPAPPVNQPPFTYNYQLIETGGSILTNIVPGAMTENELTFTANIVSGSAGRALGLVIDNRTGEAFTFNGPVISSGDPGSGTGVGGAPGVSLFEVSGPNGGNTSKMPLAGVTTEITIEGAALDVSYVSGIQLTTVGFDNGLTAMKMIESPPSEGVTPTQARAAYTNLDIVKQGYNQIVARVTMPDEFVDTNLQLSLVRNPSRPEGPGIWSTADIDLVTPSDPAHQGMTIRGPQTTSLKPNADPSQGITRLDSSKSFQSKLALINVGAPITFLIRLNQALTSPPVIYATEDTLYQAKVKNIVVTGTSSPFEWNVTCTLPTVNDLVGYPEPAIESLTPVYVGLKLSNGIPLVNGRIGAIVWQTQAIEASGLSPL